jgi:hypothetical protein
MMALDCEFDGHNGRLISMALSGTDGDEFYEVTPDSDKTPATQWVTDNVLPVLNKDPVESEDKFKEKLWNFLRRHPQEIIVADSPADFVYLMQQCHFMKDDKYAYINLDLKMYYVVSGPYESAMPHNALEDARALKKWFVQVKSTDPTRAHVSPEALNQRSLA